MEMEKVRDMRERTREMTETVINDRGERERAIEVLTDRRRHSLGSF